MDPVKLLLALSFPCLFLHAQQDARFALMHPSPADTIYLGDTVTFAWQHDTLVDNVVTELSFDDGELYSPLSHVSFLPAGGLHLLNCWYGGCQMGTWDSLGNGLMQAQWHWEMPDTAPPTTVGAVNVPDTGWQAYVSLHTWDHVHGVANLSSFRLMPAEAHASPRASSRMHPATLVGSSDVFDLLGRALPQADSRRTRLGIQFHSQPLGTIIVPP